MDHHKVSSVLCSHRGCCAGGGKGKEGLVFPSRVAEAEAVEEVGGKAGEAGTVSGSLWKYIVIYV